MAVMRGDPTPGITHKRKAVPDPARSHARNWPAVPETTLKAAKLQKQSLQPHRNGCRVVTPICKPEWPALPLYAMYGGEGGWYLYRWGRSTPKIANVGKGSRVETHVGLTWCLESQQNDGGLSCGGGGSGILKKGRPNQKKRGTVATGAHQQPVPTSSDTALTQLPVSNLPTLQPPTPPTRHLWSLQSYRSIRSGILASASPALGQALDRAGLLCQRAEHGHPHYRRGP